MKILAIETSTEVGSVALLSNETVLAERSLSAPKVLLAWLSSAIADLLADSKMNARELDAIATGIGPGSFTGVRLELATARAMAQVLRIPLYGIASLDALAFQALPRHGTVGAVLDARRGELFAGIYRVSGFEMTQVENYQCAPKEMILERIHRYPDPVCLVGEKEGTEIPRAATVGRLAFARRNASSGDFYKAAPLYIRASSAEIERRKNRASDWVIRPLNEADIPEIMAIEKSVFKTHWPESAFMNELHQNRLAHYFVACHENKLLGYAGVWLVMNEAHITTMAVHPAYRRQGIGQQLLLQLLTFAISEGARWATLEVRESNEAAQRLYMKYGFKSVGTRKNYYQEENENAVIMWTGDLQSFALPKPAPSPAEEFAGPHPI